MKLRYTAAWVGFTAVTLVSASACGTQTVKHAAANKVDDNGTIAAALARATDRTEKLGSAEISASTDLGTGPIRMEGTFSWDHGFTYDVEMATKGTQMQLVAHSPTVHALLVGGAYYYSVGPRASGPFKGKHWLKIDGSVLLGKKGAQAMSGVESGDPSAVMGSLKYAQDTKNLGEQTLNGRRTTHYRAVIDTARLGKLKDVYGDKDSLLNSMSGGATSIDVDLWIGADDLPVRVKQVIGKATVTMDFRKYGTAVKVTPPPVAEVADLSALIKRRAGGQH
ncbi:hypothetical protein [Streptomyces graminilatus]|uniref:hypothetical protein n=1 Tax=Streptomyces graminilatus TaxID=1464070 RepID=UPI0006E2D9DE|nr:hypothetical protein [Streptomyces graminilatus]